MQATLSIDEIRDLLLQTGYRKPITLITMQDRDGLVSAMIDFHLMAKVKCIMDHFVEGLKTGGLLDSIIQQPNLWEPFFVHSSAVYYKITFMLV